MLFIKNGTVIDGISKSAYSADILIDKDRIIDIGSNLTSDGYDEIDASGMWVIPGLVDAHCHLREPGFEYKEDIESGMRSAARGGFTSIACMPNTDPVIDNAPLVEYIKSRAASIGLINVYPIGAVTKSQLGKELTEMAELKAAGVVALSDDGRAVSNSYLMKTALEYAGGLDMLIISHCEDVSLSAEGVMNEGEMSTKLGLRGINRSAEDIMVARDIILSEVTGVRVHIAHVSTNGAVDLIRAAKKRGVKITCETAPHYFSADENLVDGYNTYAKVNPPLRTAKDVDAIIEGIKDGTIDIIATDHAPHHKDEKDIEFAFAANGFSGFETAFSLACTNLLKPGHIGMEYLVELLSTKPAQLLGIDAGLIKKNGRADIAIVDPHKEYVVDAEKFYSKGRNTPFNGSILSGCVIHTISSGKVVVRNGKID